MQTRKFLTTFAMIFVCVVLCAQAERQPQMQDAIRLLRQAQAAPCIEALQKAKFHLEKASQDKGGHRVRAIELIDQAIRAERNGFHPMASSKVEQAIFQVQKGVGFDDSHGRKRR